jgi:hypothetical protein
MPTKRSSAQRKVKVNGTQLTRNVLRMITTGEPRVSTPGISPRVRKAAIQKLQTVNARCTIFALKYNNLAMKTGKDARLSVAKEELQNDRAALEQCFAEEFSFKDPFGVTGNRQATIDNILSGKIRKDAFVTTGETLQIHGDVIVSTGSFKMKGSMRVKYPSGAIRRRDISGTYLSTHTYIERDGRLQLAASQLTLQPEPKPFIHGPDEKGGRELR